MRNLTHRIAPAALAQTIALAILSLAPASGFAQAAGPVGGVETQPAQLTDAQARLVEAIHRNGLNPSETPAWHLKFSYQSFDAHGTTLEKGTFEEFWAGAKKYKRIYTVGGVSQTEFQTETGLMVAGDAGTIPHGVLSFRSELIRPLPEDKWASHLSVEVEQKQADGMSLQCFRISPTAPPEFAAGIVRPEEDCIDTQTSALRTKIFTPGVHEDHFDNPQTFLGRFVPGDIRQIRMGKLRITVHLETIEAIGEVREADFVPPPDAHPVTRQVKMLVPRADEGSIAPSRIVISASFAEGLLMKKVAAVFPLNAKQAHVSGKVVLQATISKEGRIGELKVVSGPQLLQQASLDAVKQWIYRPYLLNHEPVQVETTINLVFNPGESTSE